MSEEHKALENAPMRSVHTTNLPHVLAQAGISLLVTTYQAGKLVIVRSDGDTLNTHFRSLPKPMGMAFDRGRLAVGTAREVQEFRDVPAVGRKLPPAGKHDACFLPRRVHTTGDIDVHEMAWAPGATPAHRGQLWLVNTLFSCLCTLDDEHSFVPHWRPRFVTALAAEDRCHLNGLCVRDGKPRYVTALGATDTHQGWRANKARGGVLLGVDSGEILLSGLSMPHSPRWHGGRLWLLESGDGSLGTVDLSRGRYEKVAEVPGFTRGLDFHGPLAFVGLSQVRETAAFSGIPITQRTQERSCGVWVIDVRSGATVAFLKFTGGVEEVFAVQVLPRRFPDLLNDPTEHKEFLSGTYVLPEQALKEAPASEPV